jgi:hypothetical protein
MRSATPSAVNPDAISSSSSCSIGSVARRTRDVDLKAIRRYFESLKKSSPLRGFRVAGDTQRSDEKLSEECVKGSDEVQEDRIRK